jgi:starch synthase
LSQGEEISFAILGNGAADYRDMLLNSQRRFPSNIRVKIDFDSDIGDAMIKSADGMGMPSRQEACGLVQLFAMPYGGATIANPCGGLKDTVREFDPKTLQGNGFLMDQLSEESLAAAIRRFTQVYRQPDLWRQVMLNNMIQDYSRARSAKNYAQHFESMLSHLP